MGRIDSPPANELAAMRSVQIRAAQIRTVQIRTVPQLTRVSESTTIDSVSRVPRVADVDTPPFCRSLSYGGFVALSGPAVSL